jgi:hypothetical protein
MSFDLERFAVRLKSKAGSLGERDFAEALSALEPLASGLADDPEENARVRWLIGRIHQERYLRNDPRSNQAREALERAVSAFHEVYRSAPDRFLRHGVSALALLARGRRDGIVLSGFPAPEILATEILDALDVREREGRLEEPADLAAAAEACVALGRLVEALVWTRRYTRKETDPVELTATLRQLTDIWKLDENGDAEGRLLATLRDRLSKPTREEATHLSVPTEPAHLPPEKPLATHEDVVFTVYKPKVVPPGVWVPLLAFAHLEDLPEEKRRPDEPSIREQVQEQAEAALGERLSEYTDDSEDASQGIPPEAEITFVPLIPGFRFNPPQATFLFLEAIQKEEFRMQAPPDLDGQTVRGRLSVYWGHILLAELNLKIRVDSQVRQAVAAREPETERASTRPYRYIFASYSHKDTNIVREFESRIESLGDRYLIDQKDLRSGEVWSERLQGMIREADVFQLFWSRNAMQSPFVEKEWRYALALGRESFIRPVYWEDPLPELPEKNLPPEDLRRLHFYLFPRGKAASPKGASPGGSGTAQDAEMKQEGVGRGTGNISVSVNDAVEPQAVPATSLTPKNRRRKLAWMGTLAAALLAMVVTLPLFMTGGGMDDQGDDVVFTEDTLALEPPSGEELERAAVVIGNEGVTLAQEGIVPESTPKIVPVPGTPPDEFVATEAIIASIPVEEVPAGTPITIVLTRPDGTTVKETKTVEAGAGDLKFELDKSKLRELGGYRAEVFVGSKGKIKATERVFEVEAGPPPTE